MAHNVARPRPTALTAPTDARALRTRHTLSRALLELLEERPFDQITIREIAARAGIGYATFFRHYDTKEMLLHDVAGGEIGRLLSLAHPAFQASKTRASALALCAHVDKHRALWSALLAGGAAGIVREEFVHQAKIIRIEPSRVPDWLPTELGVIHGVSATIGILAWWLSQDRPLPVDRITEILHRLVIAPIMSIDRTSSSRQRSRRRARSR